MKKKIIFSMSFLLISLTLGVAALHTFHTVKKNKPNTTKSTGLWIKNIGQLQNNEILYYANLPWGTVGVTRKAIYYAIYEKDKVHILKEKIPGKTLNPKAFKPSCCQINYFKGTNPKNWFRNVPAFEELSLGEIAKGVKLALKLNKKGVEKIFGIKPKAELKNLKFELEGPASLCIDNKKIFISLDDKKTLCYETPAAWTKSGKAVKVEYKVSENTWSICLKPQKEEVIVDPLLFSTFLGGYDFDYSEDMAVDSAGYIYITGSTWSPDFPATPGSYQTEHKEGFYDAFVSKFSPDLKLVASTFIGGTHNDYSYAIEIDSSGNIVIAGYTFSSDFPESFGNPTMDNMFICKLNLELSNLIVSRCIGGSSQDEASGIAISGSYIYIIGFTYSNDFPNTTGKAQPSYGGSGDSVVVRLNQDFSTFDATYLGGSGQDKCKDIAIDSSNNIYVVGYTNSSDFPSASNGAAGSDDGFVAKVSPDLSAISKSIYLGGGSDDYANGIICDDSDNLYVTGSTESEDFPTTTGCYNTTHNGESDLFVTKLDQGLNISASTYIGGSSSDSGSKVATESHSVFIAGTTLSEDFPVIEGCYDTIHNGMWDVVVVKMDQNLKKVLASTFLGGTTDDSADDIIISQDRCLITGRTESNDFLTIAGCYDITQNGYEDAFISVFNLDLSRLEAPTDLKAENVLSGIKLTWQDNSVYEKGFKIYRSSQPFENGDGELIAALASDTTMYVDPNVKEGETYYYQVASYQHDLADHGYSEAVEINRFIPLITEQVIVSDDNPIVIIGDKNFIKGGAVYIPGEPGKDTVFICVNGKPGDNVEALLYSDLGELVKKYSSLLPDSKTIQLKLPTGLPSGVYIIAVRVNKKLLGCKNIAVAR